MSTITKAAKPAKKTKGTGKVSPEVLAQVAKTAKTAKADAATDAAVIKKITDRKDLKYIYPADCTTLSARKAFRTQARAALKRLQKALKVATNSNEQAKIAAAQKELDAFKKQTLSPQ